MIYSHIPLYFASILPCDLLQILIIIRNIFGSIDGVIGNWFLPWNRQFPICQVIVFLILLFIVAKLKVSVLQNHYILGQYAPSSQWSLWGHKLGVHVLPFHNFILLSLIWSLVLTDNTSLTLKHSDNTRSFCLRGGNILFIFLESPFSKSFQVFYS